LDAAIKLFSEREFDRTTVDEIASLAGVGKGTIYLYFQNKEQIFMAIIEQGLENISQLLEEVANSSEEFPKRFYHLIYENLKFVETNQSFYRLLLKERMNLTLCNNDSQQRLLALHQKMHQMGCAFFESGIAQGYIRPGNPALYSLAFAGIISNFGIQWLMEGCPGSLTAQAEQAADILLKGIKSHA
jgi:AcrR family transcriptional regulator